jgi:hypothetical protein
VQQSAQPQAPPPAQATSQPAATTTTPAASKVFDPFADAVAQRQAEVKKEQIKLAYESMYGAAQQTKSAFDVTLDLAQKMRGTIGGIFGTFVGASLDIANEVRKQMPVAASPLRQEALNAINTTSSPTHGTLTAPHPVGVQSEAASSSLGAVAVAAVTVAAGFTILKGALNEANDAVSRYAQYNPVLAQAQAEAEVRAIYADIRRANEAAPQLAKFIEAQSNAQQKWEDIKLALLEAILPVLNAILDGVTTIIEVIQIIGKVPGTIIDAFLDPIGTGIALIKAIKEFLEGQEEAPFVPFDPAEIIFPGGV